VKDLQTWIGTLQDTRFELLLLILFVHVFVLG